jgi:plastocyanin
MEVTHGPIYDDSLLVNAAGTLENVVVSITAGLPPDGTFEPPSEPVVLDQKGCMFQPHVVASMVGQSVVVKNSDPLLHSVHSMDAEEAPAFNFAQPTIGQRAVQPIRVVETFRVKCDLHPWMNAWVRVFNHPYFSVTQADGAFSIRNLPPGTYRIKAWHELLGVQEKQIQVTRGKPATVEFVFSSTNAMLNAR